MAQDHFADHGKCITATPGWGKLKEGGAGHGLLYVEAVEGKAGEPGAQIVWLEWDGKPRKPISYRTFKNFLEQVNRRLREKAGGSDAPRITRWRGVLG